MSSESVGAVGSIGRALLTAALALAAPTAFGRTGDQEKAPPDERDAPEWSRAVLLRIGEGDGPADAQLHFGGRLALDFTRWDRRNANHSGFDLAALRPLFEADVNGRSQLRAELDLVGTDSKRHSYDLWVRQEFGRHLALQLGQIRVAMGSEYATREENLPLIGYGFTSYLTGRYDLGARVTVDPHAGLHGELVGTLGSGFGLEGEGKDDPLLMGRFTIEPLRAHGPEWLRGLYFGAAAAYQPRFRDELRVTTPLQSTVFATGELRADRAAWALVEAGWRCGPLRFGFEGTRGVLDNVDVAGPGVKDMDELFAWTACASVLLSGDSVTWSRGRWGAFKRAPARVRPVEDAFTALRVRGVDGPIELAVRYSNADLDRDLFRSGLASYDPSTQEVRTFSANLIFHLAPGSRFQVGAVRTLADHELSTFGGANRDTSLVARLEIDF